MKKDNKPKEKIGERILNTVTFSWWKYRGGIWVYLLLVGLLLCVGYINSK